MSSFIQYLASPEMTFRIFDDPPGTEYLRALERQADAVDMAELDGLSEDQTLRLIDNALELSCLLSGQGRTNFLGLEDAGKAEELKTKLRQLSNTGTDASALAFLKACHEVRFSTEQFFGLSLELMNVFDRGLGEAPSQIKTLFALFRDRLEQLHLIDAVTFRFMKGLLLRVDLLADQYENGSLVAQNPDYPSRLRSEIRHISDLFYEFVPHLSNSTIDALAKVYVAAAAKQIPNHPLDLADLQQSRALNFLLQRSETAREKHLRFLQGIGGLDTLEALKRDIAAEQKAAGQPSPYSGDVHGATGQNRPPPRLAEAPGSYSSGVMPAGNEPQTKTKFGRGKARQPALGILKAKERARSTPVIPHSTPKARGKAKLYRHASVSRLAEWGLMKTPGGGLRGIPSLPAKSRL